MLNKNYLLVALLSFMSISPAFSMENEGKTSQEKGAELQSPSSQQNAEQKTPTKDLKEDSPPSTEPSKKT